MRRNSGKKLGLAGLVPLAVAAGFSSVAQAEDLTSFAILAGSTVTNTGPSVITGNIGLSPGTAVTGFFSPGIVTPPYSIFINDGVAVQAQIDLVAQYTDLANRPATSNLTGRDLAGLVLAPGVYSYDTSAQLTGTLTLDAQNNPNAVFVVNIGSTLTTGSASRVALINGAQGANVFFVVGSSATVGTGSVLSGQILALTSIALNTSASINCGAALARNGAVTLDTNTISVCTATTAPIAPIVSPTTPTTPTTPVVTVPAGTPVTTTPDGTPVVTLPDGTPVTVPEGTPIVTAPDGTPVVSTPVVVPSPVVTTPVAVIRRATRNELAVARGIDNAVGRGSRLPLVFALLTPNQLLDVLGQLTGEIGTSVAPAGREAMNSFLTQIFDRINGDRSPFDDRPGRGPNGKGPNGAGGPGTPGGPEGSGPGNDRSPPEDDGLIPANERFNSRQPTGPSPTIRALGYGPGDAAPLGAMATLQSREPLLPLARPDPRLWSAWISGYGGTTSTDGDNRIGSHDRDINTAGFAGGIDYLVDPDTLVGFSIGGSNSQFDLSGGNGYGSIDTVSAALYGRRNFDAAYVSAALAASYNDVSTERSVIIGAIDRYSADFSAYDVAAQIEAGYRFDVPDLVALPGSGWMTPYASLQVQTFFTPSYGETTSASGALFALDTASDQSTATRTELGARFGRSIVLDDTAMLALRGRLAWAHDEGADAETDVSFRALPGSRFRVEGADDGGDALLASAGAEVCFTNGFAVAGFVDSKLSGDSQSYSGTGRLSYSW